MPPSTTLDIRELFDNHELADFTIEYSGRKKRCHKLVLYYKCEYFKKMLRGDSGFKVRRLVSLDSLSVNVTKESDGDVVELKDDDADAVEAMLRHIYGLSYLPTTTDGKTLSWNFHLNVAMVGDKYRLADLEASAFQEFREMVLKQEDYAAIVTIIKELPKYDYASTEMQILVDRLIEKHFVGLMKQPAFRAIFEADKGLMWKYVDRLTFAYELKEEKMAICSRCKAGQKVVYEVTNLYCAICVSYRTHTTEPVWKKRRISK